MRLALAALALAAASASAQPSGQIRLNQVGFYPDGPKRAVVVGAAAGPFSVRRADGSVAFDGTLGAARTWAPSGETVRQADFSALSAPGRYTLDVPGVGASYAFDVAAGVHAGVARAALKGFYFQRASTSLPAAFAGAWARPAGHPDTQVRVHPSAASPGRPAGTLVSAPRGWYDAGDYNKYVVNSGIAVGTLLGLLEAEPAFVAALDTGIPESGNGVPDLLDEALWNVRWMMAMQDPADGGVYHKLSEATFSGVVMPAQATATRYVVQKGTAATLDFAAVAAQASRLAEAYPAALPGLSDSLRTAALRAWAWARAHPNVRYNQAAMNAASDPDIKTGEYGDTQFGDELDWAAMELYLTTRADSFLTVAQPTSPVQMGTPYWGSVRELGYYSLLTHRARIAADVDTTALRAALVAQANGLVGRQAASAYDVPMGGESWNFGWGSNSTAANQGVVLVLAHRLTGDRRFLDAAVANLDYLLGRNATGYAFVTGFGTRSPLAPHHRPSAADGVAAPVPGLLAGGPNPGQEDGCPGYPSTLPARSYVDTFCSYASNEVAINWNAPLVALAGGVEAAWARAGSTAAEPGPGGPRFGATVAPNPFRSTAALRFGLAGPAVVTVRVLDMLGREVRRPLDARPLAPGPHEVAVDARGLPAGVYSYRVEAGGQVAAGTLTHVGPPR